MGIQGILNSQNNPVKSSYFSITKLYYKVIVIKTVAIRQTNRIKNPETDSCMHFVVVQLLSCVQLFATPWTAACQASLSFTISWSLLKLMFIELMMPSNHLILCCPLLLLPSVFPSIRVFSKELALRSRWPVHWSFSFRISPFNEYSGLISFRIDSFDLHAVQVKGFLMKVIRAFIRERRVSSTNGAGKIGYPHGKE